MAHPYVQGLGSQPHLNSHTKENTTHQPQKIEYDNTRPITPTTQRKAQEYTSKRRGQDGVGGGNITMELAYKGPRVIEPSMDGPISQTA